MTTDFNTFVRPVNVAVKGLDEKLTDDGEILVPLIVYVIVEDPFE